MHDKNKDAKSFITGEISFKWLLFFDITAKSRI